MNHSRIWRVAHRQRAGVPSKRATRESHQRPEVRVPAILFSMLALAFLGAFNAHLSSVQAQGTAFIYQGRLTQSGSNYSGNAEFLPTLWDAGTGGTQVAAGSPEQVVVGVTNGLFLLPLDFGANFSGANRWLQLEVRTAVGSFTTLTPRQALTPSPYAIAAGQLTGTVPVTQLTGTLSSERIAEGAVSYAHLQQNSVDSDRIIDGSITAADLALGTVTTSRLANNVVTSSKLASDAASLTKVTGGLMTTSGGNVGIGTASPTDALDVEGAMRLNIHDLYLREGNDRNHGLGWYGASKEFAGVNLDGPALYGWSGGGLGATSTTNLALRWTGDGNVAVDPLGLNTGSVVPGLTFGMSSGEGIASKRTAGGNQFGLDFYASFQRRMSLDNAGNLYVQGSVDTLGSTALVFSVNGTRALRLEQGGATNGAPNVIGGSPRNFVAPGVAGSAIGGGGPTYYEWLGSSNAVYSDFCAVGGGGENRIETDSEHGTIGGGRNNTIWANAASASIGGGENNRINDGAYGATISGGSGNVVGASGATIGGGFNNVIRASGVYATIPGGTGNSATNYAFAAGRNASATHTGSFVWGDSSSINHISSTNANSVTMRAAGGYRLFSNAGTTAGVNLAPGGGSWTSMSDRNAKENLQAVSPAEILDKVAALPLSTWNYTSQDAAIRHIGPMAQDFKTAFAVGESDTGITTIDADGVALAAIQGLNQRLEEQRSALEERQAEISRLERRLEKLESLLRQRTGGDL